MPADVEIIEEPAKDVRTEEGDQGEGEADFYPLDNGYLVAPEGEKEDVRADADPEPYKDVEEGLGRAGPLALPSHGAIQLPDGGAHTDAPQFLQLVSPARSFPPQYLHLEEQACCIGHSPEPPPSLVRSGPAFLRKVKATFPVIRNKIFRLCVI